ncbi:MAG TPA: hypothetical protein IAC50_07275 [Candidatus Copromorpha excrementigallinarum]|uniref:Uncharacterized protein n=1 Tax=Candidatus Allocopromorpha excrementigallinarum TaxID=2840742 RepID=A0A9D1L626_9FIRM|nr:hypothetical protein [Candidatus Copromorpha excrementigallinarum]
MEEKERERKGPATRVQLIEEGRRKAAGRERLSLLLFFPVAQTVIKRSGKENN